jgi:hypothetical protein
MLPIEVYVEAEYVTLLGKPKYFSLAVALRSQVHGTLGVHR